MARGVLDRSNGVQKRAKQEAAWAQNAAECRRIAASYPQNAAECWQELRGMPRNAGGMLLFGRGMPRNAAVCRREPRNGIRALENYKVTKKETPAEWRGEASAAPAKGRRWPLYGGEGGLS